MIEWLARSEDKIEIIRPSFDIYSTRYTHTLRQYKYIRTTTLQTKSHKTRRYNKLIHACIGVKSRGLRTNKTILASVLFLSCRSHHSANRSSYRDHSANRFIHTTHIQTQTDRQTDRQMVYDIYIILNTCNAKGFFLFFTEFQSRCFPR